MLKRRGMSDERVPDEILAKVEPEWREDMLKLLNTGEARKEFLNHIDSNCTPCVDLIAHVLKRDCEAFRAIAKILQEEREKAKRKREEELKKLGLVKRLWYRFLYFMGFKQD